MVKCSALPIKPEVLSKMLWYIFALPDLKKAKLVDVGLKKPFFLIKPAKVNTAQFDLTQIGSLFPVSWRFEARSLILLKPKRTADIRVYLFQPKKTQLTVVISDLSIRKGQSLPSLRPLPALTITTPLLVAAVSLTPNLRFAPISQTITALATRRALLLLGGLRFELFVKGVVPAFGAFWRRVNAASRELFLNPLTERWMFDVTVPPFRRKERAARVAAVFDTSVELPNSPQESSDLPKVLKNEKDALNALLPKRSKKTYKRYTFTWHRIIMTSHVAHGFVKTKKARSIKKRLAKRITSTTKRRFWIV